MVLCGTISLSSFSGVRTLSFTWPSKKRQRCNFLPVCGCLRSSAGCPGQMEVRSLVGPRDAKVMCSQSMDPRSIPEVSLAGPGKRGADCESRKRQYEWRVQSLLGPQQIQEAAHYSDSNSVCTEDFASIFREGMVNPELSFDSGSDSTFSFCSQASLGEPSHKSTICQPELLGSEARELPCKESRKERAWCDRVCGQGSGAALQETSRRIWASKTIGKGELVGHIDEEAIINSAAQDQEIVQQFEEELKQVLTGTQSRAVCDWEQAVPQGRTRRSRSIESLGDRISKLSKDNMLGQTSLQQNPPAGYEIDLPNSTIEAPMNSSPQRGSVLVADYPPGMMNCGGLITDRDGIGLRLTEAPRRQSHNQEKRGGVNCPALQAFSAGCISEPVPLQQGNTAPKVPPHYRGEVQLDKEAMNRSRPPYHILPMPAFCRTENASPAPGEGTVGKPIILDQWKRMNSSLGGSNSKLRPSYPCRNRPVRSLDSAPPPICPVWRGSGVSEGSADCCPVTTHPLRVSRDRMRSLDPPRDGLIGSSNVAKAKLAHSRSITQGAYSEGLCSLQDKLTSGGGLQAIADVSGSYSARTCCSPTKETSRYGNSQKVTVGENFGRPFAEWNSEQMKSKWDSSLNEGPNRSWKWNRSPQVSSTKRAMGDHQSPRKIAERGQHETRSSEVPGKETQNGSHQARTELVLPEGDGDSGQQDPRGRSDLCSTWRQHKVTEGVQHQPDGSEVSQEPGAAELTKLLDRNSQLEARVRELERSLESVKANPSSWHLDRFLEFLAPLAERDLKVSSLGKILSEKELERLRLMEAVVMLQAQKEAQLSTMETQRKEHVWRQVSNAEEGQQRQAQHEESLTLRELVCPLEEAMKKLSEELKQEAKTMVQNALAQEYKTWEVDREEQLQQQQLSLREKNEGVITQAKEELEKEQRNSLALQDKIIELKKRIQELKFQNHSLQQEKEQAVGDVRSQLAAEKNEELQRLREEMGLEKEREVKRLQQKIAQTEGELATLQSLIREATERERETWEQREQTERYFVTEIRKECECLHAVIRNTRELALGESLPSTKLRSPSQMTLQEALHTLHRVGEDIHRLVKDLRQELETQQQEQDLKQQQGEQFSLDKGKALAALEDRLIQNHTEDSRLKNSPMKESGSEEDHTLQQQILEKGTKLQTVQRNRAKWKDETVCKLTHNFREELNEEYDNGFLKKGEHEKKTEKLENEIQQLSLGHSENLFLQSTPTPSLTSSAIVSLRQQNFGTLKLLQHLQSRVKQLREENRIYHGSGLKDMNTAH
ncbi:uncharacterized protein si:ch211-102c2.8 isoform X2 [Hypanus sabinus]|uniref:uncharacterized protein si:ch211-102c2.8 isoform X2 n=1 Tax=Hypanus sabinus TaxID=79690 RepID=UPI0028C4BD6A|nr:uncharacterized protein si:ch211-102c2.8 isoform X2 [Hypanus sabinus]